MVIKQKITSLEHGVKAINQTSLLRKHWTFYRSYMTHTATVSYAFRNIASYWWKSRFFFIVLPTFSTPDTFFHSFVYLDQTTRFINTHTSDSVKILLIFGVHSINSLIMFSSSWHENCVLEKDVEYGWRDEERAAWAYFALCSSVEQKKLWSHVTW